MSYKQMSNFARKNKVVIADVRFTDLWGTWHHISVPISYLNGAVTTGIGYDGSSIRGYQLIESSDMVLRVDPNAPYFMDPFTEHPTLAVFANTYNPNGGDEYTKDPRVVAQRTEAYLRKSGLADKAFFGPEAEFFVFDEVEFVKGGNGDPVLKVYSEEIESDGKNHGHTQVKKGAYFPLMPDKLQDIRTAIVLKLEGVGVDVEAHHHEVARAQNEIDMHYQTLTRMGDFLQIYKNFVVTEARKRGKTATFMEKPLPDDNGSGMHIHQSLWANGRPLFAGRKYSGLSREALWYIGGLNEHARALAPIISQNVLAYERYRPGFEAPNLARGFSARNRSAPNRIPVYFDSPKARRIEFRPPGPTCNPYLAFSAMILAGMDGISRHIDPGQPLEKDFYELDEREREEYGLVTMPASLEEAVKELEKDHDFLLRSGVWTEELLGTLISEKKREVEQAKKDPMETLRRCYSYGI
ncbi:MAG: type I glutamate--ammonia ligase [Candidatus Aenigmatarchaeota archaeon]